MGRGKKIRRIEAAPEAVFFKPQGVPLSRLRGVVLTLDGLEAMRLVDAEGLSQEEAALSMNVSRPTLCRILGQARRTTAQALSSGMAIRIEGGSVEHARPNESGGRGQGRGPCPGGRGMGQGRGAGRGRGMGRGREQEPTFGKGAVNAESQQPEQEE